MRSATPKEIDEFKKQYCKNDQARISMIDECEVEVESFEDLLPQKQIISYATGERSITDSFIMFHVCKNDVEYFPVFSESTARKMLNAWHMSIPPKRSIFIEETPSSTSTTGKTVHRGTTTVESTQMRTLILFSYSLMTLHVASPDPMDGIFKEFYIKYEMHPGYTPFASEIKKINSALRNFFQRNGYNHSHENFQHLQEYIQYLHSHIGNKRLRQTDFQSLRDIMHTSYPDVQAYF